MSHVFYFGLRSSRAYLDSLNEVRHTRDPIHLVSVIGGCAFLHALGPAIRSVTLIDSDPDALSHWRLIHTLIARAGSLGEFISFLSGYRPSGQFDVPEAVFIDRAHVSDTVSRFLPKHLFSLYKRTYGSIRVDRSRGSGTIGASTVKFVGFDLTPMTFCWRFGSGNFENDETFGALQQCLERVPIETQLAQLEDLDYGECSSDAGIDTVFLASNCESPLFTKGDRIFRQVYCTYRNPIRYISWLRDIWLRRSGGSVRTSAPWPVERLLSKPAWTFQAGDRMLKEPLRSGLKLAGRYQSLSELSRVIEYGKELLIMEGDNVEELASALLAITPAFRAILWFSAIELQTRLVGHALLASYETFEVQGLPALYLSLRGLRR